MRPKQRKNSFSKCFDDKKAVFEATCKRKVHTPIA